MQGTGRRFTFGRCLGRGSFGEVYAAAMQSPGGLETQVAVKLLRADIDFEGSAVQRLRDEGRLLARLSHPAILSVMDLVTLDGRLALITELVEGQDLSSCLVDLPPRALIQALGQVAGALAAANAAPGPEGPLQLVHRDVKPSNIRLDKHGRAKLLDFGIARFDASDREVRTASDLVVGSIPYMAPERFIHREVVASSDVFSLGCTLYEGLVGKKFYGTKKVAKISGLALHPETYVAFLQDRLAGLSIDPGILGLLVDLVALEPSARPTAAMVADRCEELADDLEGVSLRGWCLERSWDAENTQVKGTLEGCTLDEHPIVVEDASDDALPVIHHQPVVTLEAASLPGPSPSSAATVVDYLDAEDVSTVKDRRAEPTLPPLSEGDDVVSMGDQSLSELHPVQVTGELKVTEPSSITSLAVVGVIGIVGIALGSAGVGVLVFLAVLGALSV